MTVEEYDFADLTAEQVKMIKETEARINKNRKNDEIMLWALTGE
ncbi:hypothetical protein Halha_1708 [Halobacteroides halobius DSM 5150]|uniref:Uncharacterized protein n=1 Tax=Halobacteroides halobius (strain ATCC 35273 / DSM 5150 / MD-1) TaxID=748449 RepID=L0KAS6_HALHC|nr:hypothetical protein [Halobacteroides halobius]AGB41645.1 hypothetical protein Halha_1708 [Halobacteroides halobius DSM 5150]